jgi:hypothetical protein
MQEESIDVKSVVLFFFVFIRKNAVKITNYHWRESQPKERNDSVMALTRAFLKGLDIEPEKIQSIIDAHSETVEALKGERDEALKNSGDVKKVAEERDTLKSQLDELQKAGDAGEIKKQFDEYKAQVESEKTAAVKREAVKAALIESGANEKYIAKMMKDVNLDEIALDKDGKLDKAKELVETVKTDWADFFGTVGEKPANIGNPPANAKPVDTSKMTDDEYFAYQRSQNRKD